MFDLASWLEANGFGRFTDLFAKNEIDGEVFVDLTDDDLKELGLTLGARKKLLKGIAALLREAAVPQPGDQGIDENAGAFPATDAERRQITVMFCDLVGSTALSGRLDPEDLRAVIMTYQNAVAGGVMRFDGYVAKFMGDGVLAYFGWPRAHEDDAERAVRAGLSIMKALGEHRAPGGEILAARIGIASGLVVVGDLIGEGAAQEEAVVGETPNLAARLQNVASPGQIVLPESTRRLLGGGFELAELGEQDLKGISEAVKAYAVLGVRAMETRFEARAGDSLAPMVGRDVELGLLLERWARAQAGEGQAVLLVGEAGIGKSRIANGLLDAVAHERHLRIRYQCLPYYSDSAFWPVTQQLWRAANLTAGESTNDQFDKLESWLGQAIDDPPQAAALIAPLLGLDGKARYGQTDLSAQARRNRTLTVLTEQLFARAAEQPVFVLLEDVHWIDPSTLEFVGMCLDRIAEAPLLMVLTSRPDNQPELAGHPPVTTLTLNRLGRASVQEMVTRLTVGDAQPVDVIEAIIARTDGVPLFVEELTKAVMETGETSVPVSLHDSLMARLDPIPEVKQVAQIAACIGRSFDYRVLAALAEKPETELQVALEQLAVAELVFGRGVPPEASYTFKHALVQDAAYESLLLARRAQLHARLLVVLEQQNATDEILAHHATKAGLTEQAIGHWHRAGELAAERSANEEARAHLTRALRLVGNLPESARNARRELEITLGLAFIGMATKGWTAPETEAAFGRARGLYDKVGDRSFLSMVYWGEYTVHLLRGELDIALRKTLEMLDLAEASGDKFDQGMAHRSVGSPSFNMGKFEMALSHMEQALSLFGPDAARPLGHRSSYDARIVALIYSAGALLHLGYPDRARSRCLEGLSEARTIAHPPSLVWALGQTALFFQFADDLIPQAGLLDEAFNYAADQVVPHWLAFCEVQRGYLAVLDGRADAGFAEMRKGLQGWRQSDVRLVVPTHLILIAKAHAALRQWDDALANVVQALALISETGESVNESEANRLKGVLLLARNVGDTADAEACLLTAIDVARGQKAKWPELRAATDLARLWAKGGERQRARDLIFPVYDWFTEGFETADLIKAKSLLDELS